MDQGKQVFKKRGRRIFTGKCKQVTTDSAIREEASKGKHVTRARGWWKRGDVAACAAHANMACWVHQDNILDDDEVIQGLQKAWEQESNKDEVEIRLQGLESHYWLGTEAGRLGCFDFPRRNMGGGRISPQRWIDRGQRTTLTGDENAEIMKTIIECLRARVIRGARTFMVKIKVHRGKPLNEEADTVAERSRQLPEDCKQRTTRTPRFPYEWTDKGVKRVST
jgi:ribonuclease HI